MLGGVAESREHEWRGAARLALPIFGVGAHAVPPSLGAMLHGLHWMVTQLGDERPMLVVVDDGQWADMPSLRWLAYIAPRLEAVHALVVIAVRTGGTSVHELVEAIADAPPTSRVTVQALSREAFGTVSRQSVQRRR